MKATIGILTLALLGSPAGAGDRYEVGTIITFNDRGSRDHFGCNDKENTLAAFYLWSETWNGSYIGDAAVNRFVQEHGDLDVQRARDKAAGRPRPFSALWRNICLPFWPGDKYRVQQIYNIPANPKTGSNAQLLCLVTTQNWDVRSPEEVAKEAETVTEPVAPFCWWIALFMPPTIVRSR
jgi:hypothetical protein